MHVKLASALVAVGLCATGCAVENANSAEPAPTQSAAAAPAPTPRPTAVSDPEPRGPAKLVHKVDTPDKVVFLTIDDGLYTDPDLLAYLRENDIPVTVFLTTATTDRAKSWQYWRDIDPNASIQNHTVNHVNLPTVGQQGAEAEICGANQAIERNVGKSPWMLRPPYGEFDNSTLAAAGDCGLDWVVHWTVSLPADHLEYQTASPGLKPGDIILTHFRAELRSQLPAVIKDIESQGFRVARLEDYLTPRGVPGPMDQQTGGTTTESRAYRVED